MKPDINKDSDERNTKVQSSQAIHAYDKNIIQLLKNKKFLKAFFDQNQKESNAFYEKLDQKFGAVDYYQAVASGIDEADSKAKVVKPKSWEEVKDYIMKKLKDNNEEIVIIRELNKELEIVNQKIEKENFIRSMSKK